MATRPNPFEGVTDLFSELTRLRARGAWGVGEAAAGAAPDRTHASAWVPTTDILAVGDDVVLRIELPGVDPDDVQLHFAGGLLTVSGARAHWDFDETAEFLVSERYYGEFRRVFTLPEQVAADAITADFADGLVVITLRGGARSDSGQRIPVTDRSSAAATRGVETG